jgi:hypothetical protein
MHKKNRPTIQDALEFRRVGTYGVSANDFVSWEDRQKALDEFTRETESLFRTHLPRTRNLVLAILVCHIIVEFTLNKFIEFAAPAQTNVTRERFSFAQKISILHMLGFPPDPSLIPSLDILNRLRNQVAHTLDLDREQVDLLIRINDGESNERKTLDDRARVKAVKLITRFICGHIAGVIYGMNAVALTGSRRATAP